MNKIAVFMSRRNKEYLSYLCQGFDVYAKEHSVMVHMYLCFGKTGMQESIDEDMGNIQYSFYEFPNLNQYDGVIIPMVTMMDQNI